MNNWKKNSVIATLSMSMIVSMYGFSEKAEAKKVVADKVFLNGNIHTIDAKNSKAQALAIKNGKIIKIGTNKEVKKLAQKGKTSIVDLHNKLVLPGFIDSHTHPMMGALTQAYEVDITENTSIEEYKNTIQNFLKNNPQTTFLRGQGWQNPAFKNVGGMPTKELLDSIVKDIPAAIYDLGHHMFWLNSKALSLVNKDDMNKPQYAKYIVKDKNGQPTGVFSEDAKDLVIKLFPSYTPQEGVNAWAIYQKQASAAGITGVFDAMVNTSSNIPESYYLAAKQNKLKMWVNEGLLVKPSDNLNKKIPEMVKTKKKYTTATTKFNTAKIFADGVIEAETAYLLSPYRDTDRPGFKGEMIWEDQKHMNKAYAALNKNGFIVHTHSIGDGATHNTLNAIEYSEKVNKSKAFRNAITHLQLVKPSDINRMQKLKVLAVTQPFWAIKDDYYYDVQLPLLGQERADKEYPIKSFIDKGIRVASSSDYPVTIPFNPVIAIEVGVTRITPDTMDYLSDPKYKLPLWKEEAVTVNDMVKSFTINGAYANKMEKERGSLEVGKYADFVVLDKDIYTIKSNKISSTKVLRTVFEGKDTFKR